MDNPSLNTADEISPSVLRESGIASVEPSAAILTGDGLLTKTSPKPPYIHRVGLDHFGKKVTSSNDGPVTPNVVTSDYVPELSQTNQAREGTVEYKEQHKPTSYRTVSILAPGTPVDAEDILCLLGRCGRYQALVFALISFVSMRAAWHLFAPIFLGADPGHHCLIPDNYTSSPENGDNNNTVEAGSCSMQVPGGGNQTQPCQFGWVYGDSFKSYLTEWNLVCERAFLADLSSSVFMAGMIVGSLFLIPLADKFGKKTVLLGSSLAQGILGVGAAFVYNDILFIVMRFFLGALHQTITMLAYAMVPEAFPSSSRTLPYFALFLCYAMGIMVLALLGYLLRDWRHLELAISVPNFITVFYYWFLPESLPWLMAKQQYKRAEAVIRKAARLNRVLLPPEVINLSTSYSTGVVKIPQNSDVKSRGKTSEKQNTAPNHSGKQTTVNGTDKSCQDEPNISFNAPVLTNYKTIPELEIGENGSKAPSRVTIPPRKYTVIDLFRTPRMRLYTFITFYLWLVNSLSYLGISFSVPNLHGDMFLNLFISGLVEVPAYLICMATVECLGRRRPACAFMLVCGCASIIGVFIPEKTETGADLTWLKTTLAMIGKFGITGSYIIIYLFCVEIFPTVVRNRGVGIASAFETAGAVAAPFIASSAKALPRLPLAIFGVLTIIGGVLCLGLPETHRKPLPETIEEVEGWDRKLGVKD